MKVLKITIISLILSSCLFDSNSIAVKALEKDILLTREYIDSLNSSKTVSEVKNVITVYGRKRIKTYNKANNVDRLVKNYSIEVQELICLRDKERRDLVGLKTSLIYKYPEDNELRSLIKKLR